MQVQLEQEAIMRKSGILLHISSLPSRYGIGRMGKAAYDFVDFLHMSETACWQILPLSPTSYGDSPYQSFSVYAGNPYFIDFVKLESQGLLTREDYTSMLWQRSPETIDYELLYRSNITAARLHRLQEHQQILAEGLCPVHGAQSRA